MYEIVRDKLDSCFRRLKERQARREDEDYDEQVEEELEEEVCGGPSFSLEWCVTSLQFLLTGRDR